MHRLRSKSALTRFRISSVLLCLKLILFPVVVGLLIYSLTLGNHALTKVALILFGVAVLLSILQWITAARTTCPLCMTPVLARKECARHRKARSFLGNFRLRVALAILFRNKFRCPYCNEITEMQVRDRSVSRSYSEG